MNKVRPAWWGVGSAVAIALALGACHSAPTRFYGIDPSAPATHINSYQAPALRVDTVSVPASWDRLEILGVSASGEIQISEFDHWSAPLAQIARQALADDLDQRLPPGSVIYPRLPRSGNALSVNVDILEFSVTASQAVMQASWLVTPPAGSQSAKRSAASFHTSMTSKEPAAVAHAWSQLIGQLADRIGADATSFNMP
jgi:uncharacterized lipoprotein YmbA